MNNLSVERSEVKNKTKKVVEVESNVVTRCIRLLSVQQGLQFLKRFNLFYKQKGTSRLSL